MVFQFAELLPELTVVENVALPLRLLGQSSRRSVRSANEHLAQVGLREHADAHPGQLSGGEMQRAGIARALVSSPQLVLADEPTGALDEANSMIVAELLVRTATTSGPSVLIITHDRAVAGHADRTITLRDGVLDTASIAR